MEDRIPERALVVSAHPDDLDFGCNGAATLWTRAGCKVSYVICTNGDKGAEDPEIPNDVLIDIRKKEQTEAARTAGVNEVFFLGVEDGELENTKELRRSLVEIVRKVRPEVVFCQDPANLAFENAFVAHRDHRAAAQAAFDALYPAAGNSRFFPELLEKGLEPYHVREIFFFGTNSPNHWIDVTEVMDVKLNALRCHVSQVGGREGLETFIRDRFREFGKQAGYEYAEAFRRLPLPM